jgi:hypothetical protein
VFEDEPLPAPDRQTVAVLTGSWEMVTDRLVWSEHLAAQGMSHQLMAIANAEQRHADSHRLTDPVGGPFAPYQTDGKAAARPFRYRRGVSTTRCCGACRPHFPRI